MFFGNVLIRFFLESEKNPAVWYHPPSLHCRRAKGNQLLTGASRLALQTLVRR